jgi:hypothetical protein
VPRVVYFAVIWFAGLLAARAQLVVPVSYTENSTGSTGEFTYFDTTPPSKLTDGVLGTDNWQADLGHGPAAEWVGWDNGVIPSLVFTFTGGPTINQVQVGFNRSEEVNIFLPTAVTINGTVFPVPDCGQPVGVTPRSNRSANTRKASDSTRATASCPVAP